MQLGGYLFRFGETLLMRYAIPQVGFVGLNVGEYLCCSDLYIAHIYELFRPRSEELQSFMSFQIKGLC